MVDRLDPPGLLGNRDEAVRKDQLTIGVLTQDSSDTQTNDDTFTTIAGQPVDWSGGCSLNPYAATGTFGLLWIYALVMLTPLAAVKIRRKKKR